MDKEVGAAGNFFQRWTRLKTENAPTDIAEGQATTNAVDARPGQTASTPTAPNSLPAGDQAAVRLPTHKDAAALGVDSDYTAFMAQGVDKSVQRLAMKKLFADPHFNLMDGLDIYIDDYNRATPVSAAMLAALGHAQGMLARGTELQARNEAAAAKAAAAEAVANDSTAAQSGAKAHAGAPAPALHTHAVDPTSGEAPQLHTDERAASAAARQPPFESTE